MNFEHNIVEKIVENGTHMIHVSLLYQVSIKPV